MPGGDGARVESADVRAGRLIDTLLRQRAGAVPERPAAGSSEREIAEKLRVCLGALASVHRDGDEVDQLIRQQRLQPSDDERYRARLGAFGIVGVLGSGGMGVVLDAFDTELSRAVALKILHPELARDTRIIARFRREAQAAAALDHPNIVTIYGVGEEAGVAYIAMQRVAGTSLDQLLEQWGALPAELIREIMRQLLSGFAAAHAAGLVHRDIKPSNIMLEGLGDSGMKGLNVDAAPPVSPDDRPGFDRSSDPNTRPLNPSIPESLRVRLVDFGLARMRGARTQLTQDGRAVGTPDYMSPEQARGDEVDHRTDLYSAGVVLYEMLTGQTPFHAADSSATIYRILHEEPRGPWEVGEGVDSALGSVALRLLEKQPEHRLDTAVAVLAHVEAGTRARRRFDWRRWRVALAVAAVAVAAMYFGILLLMPRVPVEARIVRPENKAVEVRYEGWPNWRRLYAFSDEIGIVHAATAVDLSEAQGRVVAVGTQPAPGLANLFCLSARGEKLWDLTVEDIEHATSWRDSSPGDWSVQTIVAEDVDGVSGDELIVLAHHVEDYAACVAIIDPRSQQQIGGRFWNAGHLHGAQIERDYFEDGRSALVVWGTNNKLDGWDDGTRTEACQAANWDWVPAVMILDLDDLAGVSPP